MKTMAQDYYDTLGISKTASQDEIQKAYRRLARKYHPDLNPDDKAAQQKFKDIQTAYDILSEPEKRKMYDQFGPDFEHAAAGGGPFRGGAGAQPGGGFSFEEVFGGGPGGFQFEGDLGDLFRQFGGGGPAGGGRSRGRAAPSKGSDLTANLTVPFNTAVLGGEASIAIRRAGKSETIQVKIPPGVETGRKMRLRGQGEPAPTRGAQSGDLIVTLTVANHPHFNRHGKNLEVRLPLTLGEALLGATVDVPTPGGTVSLKVPAGSSSGRRLRVRGQGVRATTGDPGDLFVELQIKLPEKIRNAEDVDAETRTAIERLESNYSESPRRGIIW